MLQGWNSVFKIWLCGFCFLFCFLTYIMCASVLPVYRHMHHVWCPVPTEVPSPGTSVLNSCGPSCGCWESYAGPQQEHVLLTAKPSLQSLVQLSLMKPGSKWNERICEEAGERAWEHGLLLHRTWALFPAPTWWLTTLWDSSSRSDVFSGFLRHKAHMWYRDTYCRQNIHTHNNKSFFKNNRWWWYLRSLETLWDPIEYWKANK